MSHHKKHKVPKVKTRSIQECENITKTKEEFINMIRAISYQPIEMNAEELRTKYYQQIGGSKYQLLVDYKFIEMDGYMQKTKDRTWELQYDLNKIIGLDSICMYLDYEQGIHSGSCHCCIEGTDHEIFVGFYYDGPSDKIKVKKMSVESVTSRNIGYTSTHYIGKIDCVDVPLYDILKNSSTIIDEISAKWSYDIIIHSL
jgi:hypothetical protein